MKKKAIEKIMFVKDGEPRYKNRVYMSCQTPDIKKEKHLICDFYTKEEGFILRIALTDKDFANFAPKKSSMISFEGWCTAMIHSTPYYWGATNGLFTFERKLIGYNVELNLSIGSTSLKLFNEYVGGKINNSKDNAKNIFSSINYEETEIIDKRRDAALDRRKKKLDESMKLFNKESEAFLLWVKNNSPMHYMFRRSYNKDYVMCTCSHCLNKTMYLKKKIKNVSSMVCPECKKKAVLYSGTGKSVTRWFENYVRLPNGKLASRHYKAYYIISEEGEELDELVEISRIIYTSPKNNGKVKVEKYYHKRNNFLGNEFWDDCDLYGMAHITTCKGLVYPSAKALLAKRYDLDKEVLKEDGFSLETFFNLYHNNVSKKIFYNYMSKKLYKMAADLTQWSTNDVSERLPNDQLNVLIKMNGGSSLVRILEVIGDKPYSMKALKKVVKDHLDQSWEFRSTLTRALKYVEFDSFIDYIFSQPKLTALQAVKRYSKYLDICDCTGIDISTYAQPALTCNTITRDMLKGTPYQYSGIESLYDNYCFESIKSYLNTYKKYPEVEMLVKSGLTKIAMLDSSRINKLIVDPSEKNVMKKWGVTKEQYNRLVKMKAGFVEFKVVQNENNWLGRAKPSDKEVRYICDIVKSNNYYSEKIIERAMPLMTARKFINYVEKQKGIMYDANKGNLFYEWFDYLSMAEGLKMDVSNIRVFAPSDIVMAHANCVALGKKEDLKKKAADIKKEYPGVESVFDDIRKRYEYVSGDYAIIVPSSIEDVLFEGAVLNHCLVSSGTNWKRYWARMDEQSSYIVFLRKKDKECVNDYDSSEAFSTPFVTLEIEPGGTIRQRRGYGDTDVEDEDILAFIKEWQKYVASKMTAEDRKLSKMSAIKRALNYAELRDNKTVVWHGKHQGELLADIFQKDEILNTFLVS